MEMGQMIFKKLLWKIEIIFLFIYFYIYNIIINIIKKIQNMNLPSS